MLVTRPMNWDSAGYFASMPSQGSAIKLLHAEADALGFRVEADHLHFDSLTDGQGLGRMVDAAPCDVGDVQQAVDTAQIDERTVIGDVLDDTVENLALFEAGYQLVAGLGTCLFENCAAGHDDVAAIAVHLQDLEWLRRTHQWGDVANWPDVDLAAWQEGHSAREIDGKATFDSAKDNALDLLAVVKSAFQDLPRFFTASFITGEHSLTVLVLKPFDVNVNRITNAQLGI